MSKPLMAEVICTCHSQYEHSETFNFVANLGSHERGKDGQYLGVEIDKLTIQAAKTANCEPAKPGTRYRVILEEIKEDSTE